MKKLILLGAVALVAMGISASSAMAGEYTVTANGGPYTGAVHGELEASNAVFTTGAGQAITCNQSHLTGNITSSEAAPSTVNGTLNSLSFSNNGNSFCPSTISGTSSCETEVLNLPYSITVTSVNHAAPTLSLNNVDVTLHCNSFIGRIECSLEAASIVTQVVGDEIRVVNQPLTSDSGFPCPPGGTFSAVYDLRTTGSNFPVTLVEN